MFYLIKIYLEIINKTLENIQKSKENQNVFEINTIKNKINTIRLSNDYNERISNISNGSSRIIDNCSEKQSFLGFLKNDDCPPDMSFDDEDL